jgi:heat shock protein HslJ
MLFLPSYHLLAQNSSFRIKVKSGLQNTPPYLVKYYNSKNWEKFYANILKFEYDPKYEYDIKVAKHKKGPNSTYTLTKTFAKSLSENTDVATWEISDSYVNAQRLGKLKCLQIKTDKKNKWEYLNTSIRGFDYQEGYRYRIRVKQTKQKDIDTIDYSLVEIISKEKTNELPSVAAFLARFKWNLLQLNGKNVTDSKASIGFDAKNGTVAGTTGCNNFWGNFIIKDNKISFPHLASTIKACNRVNIENDFFEVLDNKHIQFDIADQTLNLYLNNKLIMIFGLERE